jgi:hypothetical protein
MIRERPQDEAGTTQAPSTLPLWGAVGLAVWFGYVFLGPEARAAALFNLALLLPFVAVARRLTREPDAIQREAPARV